MELSRFAARAGGLEFTEQGVAARGDAPFGGDEVIAGQAPQCCLHVGRGARRSPAEVRGIGVAAGEALEDGSAESGHASTSAASSVAVMVMVRSAEPVPFIAHSRARLLGAQPTSAGDHRVPG